MTCGIEGFQWACSIHSRKLTWKPKKGPIKTTVLLKGDHMGFHVSLGECNVFESTFKDEHDLVGPKPYLRPLGISDLQKSAICGIASGLRAGALGYPKDLQGL